jgi:hypothetical protein
MMQKDPIEIKNRIVQFLNSRGAMLPIYISKEIGLESLFTSAFLSELVSEGKIKVSTMRVGNSPIYFTNEKKEELEKFGNYLGNREKEAFIMLKEKKFLEDSEQEPAIRVALRNIKDFAVPFRHGEKIIWRYFLTSESEFKKEKKDNEKIEEKEGEKKEKQIKKKRKEKPKQKNNNFFEKVKGFLTQKGKEISSIEFFSNKELILKVKENDSQKLLIAFNKKKITEKDFLKAHKKAKEANLNYIILTLEEPAKKISNFIEAIKGLSEIEFLNKNI